MVTRTKNNEVIVSDNGNIAQGLAAISAAIAAQDAAQDNATLAKNSAIVAAINIAGLETLRKNVSRFHKVIDGTDYYVSVSLLTPDSNVLPDTKYSERMKSAKIVTNQGTCDIAALSDTVMIAFSLKIVTVGNKTAYTHETLSQANQGSFDKETTMTLFVAGQTISGIESHLGFDMPQGLALSYVNRHVEKLGKTQQWKAKKGVYSLIEK